MIDRELLELAAKAAGYTPVGITDDGTALLLEGIERPWNALNENPHTDCMGDAGRLAVKLRLSIMYSNGLVEVSANDGGEFCTAIAIQSIGTDDAETATCRAIVRAAAPLAEKGPTP